MKRSALLLSAGALALVSLALPAFAQAPGAPDALSNAAGDLASLIPAGDGAVSGRIVQLFGIVTVLSIAPGLLVMVTAFTRVVIALSILRTGLGLQSTPANLILISLSLFITFFVMMPTFDQAWRDGLQPLMRAEITEAEALPRIAEPFRGFMLDQVREQDLALFNNINEASIRDRLPEVEQGSGEGQVVDFRILVPAFMISELRRAFEIGFLLFIPFLIIDLVVASILMAVGMMMVPPATVALPFKLIFFVLVDGWTLVAGSLIQSYGV